MIMEMEVIPFFNAVCACLSETTQSHVWYYGLRGHSGEIAGKVYVGPLVLILDFFCVVETLCSVEECLSGTCGLVGPDILVRILLVLWLRSLMLVGGSRMGTWSWVRRMIF